MFLGILPSGFARERGPRVEVICPSSPIPVKLGDHQVLVYELHITNFDVVPLTLRRLEVFDGQVHAPERFAISTGTEVPLDIFVTSGRI
jgi:hypothetical protein